MEQTFTREYNDIFTKIRQVWHYDLNKFPNGPIKIETFYPSEFVSEEELKTKLNKKLPITKQTFFNPENGKYVGYSRAKSLGLIK